jgi:hypothetical protein
MKVLAALLAFVLVMVLFFMMGAFVGNSFNIGDWTQDGRFVCMMLGFVGGCVAAGGVYNEMN